ncbi:MAG: Crp/Fnr family transcriptional regulator [Maioricimonas sp. JB049]
MDDKFWFLKNCDLFERLSPEQVQRLESVSHAKQYARGSLIYMPAEAGESVFLLTSGRIKLYHITAEGKQAVLALIDPGELFGELTVFDGGDREEFAEAMEKSTLIRIPRAEITRLIEEHASVAVGVTRLMGLRRRRIERRLKSLLFRSNRERLIHLLMELAEKYGRRSPDGVTLGIKLSHQELASIIGSTRETVTVVLGELQNERSLIIKRRQIILTDMENMARSIEQQPPRLPTPATQVIPAARRPAGMET